MSSILNDIKHKIGPSGDYKYYDKDIIDAINAAFGTLTQIGVGPEEGFSIEDDTIEWESFVQNTTTLNLVKTFIYENVRLVFDPPNSSFVLSAIKEHIQELTWRLNVENDPAKEVSHEG